MLLTMATPINLKLHGLQATWFWRSWGLTPTSPHRSWMCWVCRLGADMVTAEDLCDLSSVAFYNAHISGTLHEVLYRIPWAHTSSSGSCYCNWDLRLDRTCSWWQAEKKNLCTWKERKQVRMSRLTHTCAWMAGPGCSALLTCGAGQGWCGPGMRMQGDHGAEHRQDEWNFPAGHITPRNLYLLLS